jgi:hypothetical protein
VIEQPASAPDRSWDTATLARFHLIVVRSLVARRSGVRGFGLVWLEGTLQIRGLEELESHDMITLNDSQTTKVE